MAQRKEGMGVSKAAVTKAMKAPKGGRNTGKPKRGTSRRGH